MHFLVIEIQTMESGQVGNFVFAFEDRPQAEAKYHALLSVAAVSGLPLHAVVLLDNTGRRLAGQCYPAPEVPQ